MKIIQTISGLDQIEKGCVLSIGNFDGVHMGHRAILSKAKQIAAERKTQLAVVTFQPHPLAVLQPEKTPRILTSPAVKKYLLDQSGVEFLYCRRG